MFLAAKCGFERSGPKVKAADAVLRGLGPK